jgi:anti-sigma factor RsiW
MSPHASAADLQLYVLDALGGVPKRWLEAHLVTCDACGEALAAEAALECTLRDLWPALRRPLADVLPLRPPAPPPRRSSPPALPSGSGSAFAAAAVALLFMGWWADGGRAVVAPAASAPLACLTPGFSSERAVVEDAVCRKDDGDGLTCAPLAAVCALPSGE